MSRPLVRVLVLASIAPSLAAQCPTVWTSAGPQSVLSGAGHCSTLWDPDGAGPLPQRLVIGGDRLLGGSHPVHQRVMTWDGAQWQHLGTGPGTAGTVRALTTWNGLLVAGGTFTGAGTDRIAQWDGSSWQPIGTGFPAPVAALTVWNGLLVAVGDDLVNGLVTAFVHTWDGVAWTALPPPPSLRSPLTAVPFEGDLCVGGSTFLQGFLERWNGSAWAPTIAASGPINCLAVRWVGIGVETLFAAGNFLTIGGATVARIASTPGAPTFAWSPLGAGLPVQCAELHVRHTGIFSFTAVARLGGTAAPIMQFTTSSGVWTSIGNASVTSLLDFGGSYHGSVLEADGAVACRRYDGSAWQPVVGPGIAGDVRAATRSGGDVVLGGTFQAISGAAFGCIARWDGATFSPLGSGMTGISVDALLTLDNGDIVAGGSFVAAGGTTVNNIARWNGTTWLPLGGGLDFEALALCQMPNGDLVVGGRFTQAGGVSCSRIARWDGSAWSPLGSGMNGHVMALAVRSDGVLFAGGNFTNAGGVQCSRIAQWNGTAWSPLGFGCNSDVYGLAVRPNDDLVAVGAFTHANGLLSHRCARFMATGWAAMGTAIADTSPVRAVHVLPNGDVAVGRGFHAPGTDPDPGISRWNGASWSGFDSGLAAHDPALPVEVRTIVQRADGDLVVGGRFSLAGGAISYGLASAASTCMPQALSYGTGCSSGAGPLVLTAETLPWAAAPFRTTTSGLDASSLCARVIGLTQLSSPLDGLLPQGQPGCSLLATLDIVDLWFPSAGVVHAWFALPPDPVLNGLTFFQQSVQLEFDAAGALVAVRGSNALAATIGTL
jgi:hypothetical protein